MKACKICFKEIKEDNLLYLFNPELCLCLQCYKRLKPKFISFKVDTYHAVSIYDYDEDIRALLYQFKGCFDYELGPVFLDRYFKEIRLKYFDYIIVPIPSYIDDDKIRGFNHVETIFQCLKMNVQNVLIKTDHYKQADHNKEERQKISKHLKIVEGVNLFNKKVLIVDDVYSTGSTMKAAIKLIETLHPKKIEVLVMSKTVDSKYINKQD